MARLETAGFFHSVHLNEEKCKGCVNCIKHCPTEAIRVREGKANILEDRCIDCGECVRICPNQAKTVIADTLDRLREFSYNVALPAPAIYGQFREGTDPNRVIAAFLAIGFDHVVDVAFGADLVAMKIAEALKGTVDTRPLISSACPAVVRLIQVRFPNLIENIIPVISPMRAAAMVARRQLEIALGPEEAEQAGLWFITPCPGKVSAINEPAGYEHRCFSGAIPIAEVYPLLREKLSQDPTETDKPIAKVYQGTGLGLGWARSGGENQSIGVSRQIAVDGIHNVIQILEEVERGKLSDIDYIEAQACVGGCVGGVLTVENSFITRRRVRLLATERLEHKGITHDDELTRELLARDGWFKYDKRIEPRAIMKLDEDMAEAMRKMEQMERILESLPGLDCGSCGAPNCQALAEDVVRGVATETDCVFKLRERVRELAGEMVELAEKAPPAMGMQTKKTEAKSDTVTDSAESEAEATDNR